jgi:glycosyltransferase involved in cell wall biosynthesis
MSERQKMSVIIPFYNTGESLLRLLGQILKSGYENLEIICVDDASNDDSLAVVQRFARKHAEIQVIEQARNHGAASARNKGIAAATGDLICFLDSDDEISPKFFDKFEKAMRGDAILAACSIKQKYLYSRKVVMQYDCAPAPRKAGEDFRTYIVRLMTIDARLYPVVNKVFRGEVIRKNKIRFDKNLDFAEDTKFVLDYLGCFEDGIMKFLSDALYIYNYGTSTSTVANSALRWENWRRSYADIKEWARGGNRARRYCLEKLWLRFRVSHALAVTRAPLSYTEKRQYVSFPEYVGAKIINRIKK